MAKIAIVYRINADDKPTHGIYQKMVGQAEAWRFLGHEVACFYTRNDGLYQDNTKLLNIDTQSLIYSKIWYFGRFYRYLTVPLTAQNFDLIIFRYSPISIGLNRLASKVLKKNPEVKLVIDLPTYPFTKEYGIGKNLVLKFLEGQKSKHSRYFNAILHLGKEEEIFGIPTLKMSNGVNVERYHPKSNFETASDKMRLIFIGSLFKWQNLQALLLAANEYLTEKPNIDFSLKIIGTGPELKNLQDLAMSKPLLLSRVFFIPPLYGSELDAYINESDIGIGYLGGSNRGVTTLSPLKHRHFAARGLPFVYRCIDEDFENNNFAYKMNDQNLSKESIYQLVEWYLSFYEHYNETSETLRDFAERQLSWEKQCEKIIAHFNII